MALAVSIILTGIAIGLLAVYGADVAAAMGEEHGFLPLDHMTRGIGLGMPSIILPIAAFFISRKEPSKPLGGMLVAAGVLIIAGGAVGLVPPEEQADASRAISQAVPLLAVGAFITALGGIKIKRS